jgi:16S rRNA (cytosine1402-N4)-methyltransferase
MTFNHPTVLLEEATDLLVTNPHGIYCDVTCGGGGHTLRLLEKYPHIKVIASDWDLDAVKAARERTLAYEDRVFFEYGAFANIDQILKKQAVKEVDGILADFGTSRHQIMQGEGFSFKNDTFLDMRMAKGYFKILACDILAKATEKEIADILYEFGEEFQSRKIAKAIIEERKIKPIRTTLQLVAVIEKAIGKTGKIHPATKTFQALRIAVNQELDQIDVFLKKVSTVLKNHGRIACISFHSLEDRKVKYLYQENKNIFIDISKGIITPTVEEIKRNSASRSAKMRVLEKNLK